MKRLCSVSRKIGQFASKGGPTAVAEPNFWCSSFFSLIFIAVVKASLQRIGECYEKLERFDEAFASNEDLFSRAEFAGFRDEMQSARYNSARCMNVLSASLSDSLCMF